MAMMPDTIKIDASEAMALVASCLEPGSVLLPASAVRELWGQHGVTIGDLIMVGGIVADVETKSIENFAAPTAISAERLIGGIVAPPTAISAERFAEKMDELDKRNPKPLANLLQEISAAPTVDHK